jgi:hypothetical protein
MKFIDYVATLNDFLNKNPECKEMEVVSSSDDEGNSYNKVLFTPTKGHLDENDDFSTDDLQDDQPINSVCIN